MAPIVALVRFGRWDEVLRQPAPPREWLYTRGVWHYARGLAFAAKGQAAEARARAGRARSQSLAVGARRADGRVLLPGEGTCSSSPPTSWPARSRRKAGDTRQRRAAPARRRGRAGHALVHRAAALVFPGAPRARRRAAAGQPRGRRPSRSTARTSSTIRATAGRCSAWPRACARRARRPKPRRPRRPSAGVDPGRRDAQRVAVLISAASSAARLGSSGYSRSSTRCASSSRPSFT